jgi:hypothetical protein
MGNGFGGSSEFGFGNCLRFFGLLPPIVLTDPDQARYRLGFGFPALSRLNNPLPFFALLPGFSPLQAPHNPQVEDGRPLPFKSFWARHFS